MNRWSALSVWGLVVVAVIASALGCGTGSSGESDVSEWHFGGDTNPFPSWDISSGQDTAPAEVTGEVLPLPDTVDPGDTDEPIPDVEIDLGPCGLGPDYCDGIGTAMICNGAGAYVATPCLGDTACFEGVCAPIVCDAGETECIDDATWHKCHYSGTFWEETQSCGDSHYCDHGTGECLCVNPANIMFVLDASGSMQLESVGAETQWDIATAAIATIMEEYPSFSYGLTTFPDATVTCNEEVCYGNGGCNVEYVNELNYEVGSTSTAINTYLASRQLSSSPDDLQYVRTPLLGIMEYFLSTYPATGPLKASPYPSYLVLISDGEDSCYHPYHPEFAVGPLGQVVGQLRDEWGIKVVSIGFNIESGTDQLDAIVTHGGTGLAEHLSAADMTTLMAALGEVVDLIDPHKCVGVDIIAPPQCEDADLDGWCQALDCDDTSDATSPGASEVSGNGIDDDCNGFTDEPPPLDFDDDGDGYTENQGDCNDFEPKIGPSAYDGVGDGQDNDCDGAVDEGADCSGCTKVGGDISNLTCAMELCESTFVLDQYLQSLSGVNATGLASATEAVTWFGSTSNDLAPQAGGSYTLLATGIATGTSHSGSLSGNYETTCPYSGDDMNDAVEIVVQLQAPWNAQGFSFDYVFFSEEYEEFIGSSFNDKFFVIMKAPVSTGNQDQIINYTDCRPDTSYYDFLGADCANGKCCYIAINTAFSEPCSAVQTDISGTGFSCGSGSTGGSSTGWLKTTMTITGGEIFTLRFHIHDTSDAIYDSEVILDNFQWSTTAVTPGTEPVD